MYDLRDSKIGLGKVKDLHPKVVHVPGYVDPFDNNQQAGKHFVATLIIVIGSLCICIGAFCYRRMKSTRQDQTLQAFEEHQYDGETDDTSSNASADNVDPNALLSPAGGDRVIDVEGDGIN